MASVVLVHGFWADGSSWAGVIGELVSAGHDPVAVQLPLSSLDDDVATVQRALHRIAGPKLLVGHSYAGVVISVAAAGRDDVSGLVYAAAYAPEAGEDVNQINEAYPPAGGGAAIRPTDDGHLWLDVDGFADAFAADVDPKLAAVMARTQGPASFACLQAFTVEPAWKTLPSAYVIATEDRTINPDAQRMMAQRMGATVTEVSASHAVLVSQPAATARAIMAAL